MRCIRPIKAGFNQAGDIVYSTTKASPELASFEFECRKCLPCRLNIAREKATRCIHEAQCHEDNIFLTLTYNEESLKSPRLQYRDFQLFMKRLRDKVYNQHIKLNTERLGQKLSKELKKEIRDKTYIPFMVTGEYGDINKRPHWHAIIFNYYPNDSEHKYTTDRGEKVFSSNELSNLWGKGNIEYGSVTMDSAGYVARYAAKKLTHGNDQDHDYHPFHRTSCKRAIGRTWIEKYWKQTFQRGYIVLPNGSKSKIPRYYVDWLKKYRIDDYIDYVNTVQKEIIEQAELERRKEETEFISQVLNRRKGRPYPVQQNSVKLRILERKFKNLQENLKL